MTREEKAIHGLLYADGSYESFPVYYLSREWEYYPDALLTPEDDLDKYYFRYISIGEIWWNGTWKQWEKSVWEWYIPVKNHASR